MVTIRYSSGRPESRGDMGFLSYSSRSIQRSRTSSGATFLGGWGLPSDCTRTGRALGLCASSLAVTPAWLRTFARKMRAPASTNSGFRSEEHTSELQSRLHLVCRLLLEKKKEIYTLRLTVSKHREHLDSVRLIYVLHESAYGNVKVTAQALLTLFARDIDVIQFSCCRLP